MTEAEWLACDDPATMLEFLRGNVSDRKLRLFAVACCRRIWHLLPDGMSRKAVEQSELYADGGIDKELLSAVRAEAEKVYVKRSQRWRKDIGDLGIARRAAAEAAKFAASATALASQLFEKMGRAHSASFHAERLAQKLSVQEARLGRCDLLRELFGNPLRPPSVSPVVLAWNDCIISKLAEGIYEERAFDRLPILADAVEEAGCPDTRILDHLRGPGPHVRGCWVLDLLMGRS